MPSLVKIVSVVLEKKWKCEKFDRQADRQMDNRQSEKLTWASAKVS